jgi:Anti-sigma-D factor RsdA to sigma factor binding region
MPVDLAAVQADDALLDLIGQAEYPPSAADDDADDELTRVLAAWRREVRAAPFGELVDTNTAVAVIRAASRPVPRRNPVFGSIAAAAAVLVIGFSAVGLVAKSAQPGDRLWGVTQVLYSDYARSVETAAAVRTELNEAKTALKEGKPERARASLQRVQKQLPVIGEAEGRTDLTARHRQLEQLLNGSSDASSANLPRLPMFPLPVAPHPRREPSTPPKSGELPTPADSNAGPNATSNSIPELPGDMTVQRPSRVAPNREHPGRSYDSSGRGIPGTDGSAGRGIPGPDGGATDSGPSSHSGPSSRLPGRGTPGSNTTGKDVPGATSTDGDNTNGDGSSNSDSVRSDSPKTPNTKMPNTKMPNTNRGHLNSNPPGDGSPLGCQRVGPRPPSCG